MIEIISVSRRDGELHVRELTERVLSAAATAGENNLRRNLSAGPRSGYHYAGQPRRSSSPEEYSQEQQGTLKGMVKSGPLGDGRYFFGLVPQGSEQAKQAREQEYGAPEKNLEERANVRRTAAESTTRRDMQEAVRRAV